MINMNEQNTWGCGETIKQRRRVRGCQGREGESLGFLIEESWGVCPGSFNDKEAVE